MNTTHTNVSNKPNRKTVVAVHAPTETIIDKFISEDHVDIGRIKTFMTVYGYSTYHLACVAKTSPSNMEAKLNGTNGFWTSELQAIEAFFFLDEGEFLIKS